MFGNTLHEAMGSRQAVKCGLWLLLGVRFGCLWFWGMQRYTAYDALFTIEGAVTVLMNGKAY
jgi:hypothetical protein